MRAIPLVVSPSFCNIRGLSRSILAWEITLSRWIWAIDSHPPHRATLRSDAVERDGDNNEWCGFAHASCHCNWPIILWEWMVQLCFDRWRACSKSIVAVTVREWGLNGEWSSWSRFGQPSSIILIVVRGEDLKGKAYLIGRAGGATLILSEASSDSEWCINYLRACSILIGASIAVAWDKNSLETCLHCVFICDCCFKPFFESY